jgi:BirA family biotin operon repressor/biotin-[acetyl-CoA-carboxylase] ligase
MTHSNSLFGSHKIILSDVDSTNNFAAKLVNEGIGRHGSVIMAENQSNGRGQQGAIWQSQPKSNLLFSIILCADPFLRMNPIYINWYVSICLVDLLKAKNIKACIKWPNDILIGDKKLAGILIENKFQGSQLKQSIVGIGLNVNQTSFSFSRVTSMTLQTNIEYSLEELLNEFLFTFRENEGLLKVNDISDLKERYLSLLFGLDQDRVFQNKKGEFKGRIKGIDDTGRLLIEYKGEQQAFRNKEVRFL